MANENAFLQLFYEQANVNEYKKYETFRVKEALNLIETKKPITLDKEGKKSVDLPQWPEALAVAKKEAIEQNNPLAAYISLYIIKTLYGVQTKPDDFRELSKILYKHNICEGFLSYGKVFEDMKDYIKAKEIYKEGTKKCKASFYPNLLQNAYSRVEYKIKKGIK